MGVKSLREIELEFQMERLNKTISAAPEPKKKGKKRRGKLSVILGLLFFIAIFVIFLTILTSDSSNGAPRTVMGFACCTVLTPSMQREIPKGSLIIVRQTDPKKLKIGDTITYMKNADISVTHKIIDIYKDRENSGALMFRTKGTENANPDKEPVNEANIVGKVIFTVPALGTVITYLRTNIYITVVILGLCLILFIRFNP